MTVVLGVPLAAQMALGRFQLIEHRGEGRIAGGLRLSVPAAPELAEPVHHDRAEPRPEAAGSAGMAELGHFLQEGGQHPARGRPGPPVGAENGASQLSNSGAYSSTTSCQAVSLGSCCRRLRRLSDVSSITSTDPGFTTSKKRPRREEAAILLAVSEQAPKGGGRIVGLRGGHCKHESPRRVPTGRRLASRRPARRPVRHSGTHRSAQPGCAGTRGPRRASRRGVGNCRGPRL